MALSLTDANHQTVGSTQLQQPLISDTTNTPSGNGSQVIFFQKPSSGNYTLTVSNSQGKTYRMNIYEYDVDGGLSFHDIEGSLSVNGTNTIQLNFDKVNATNSQANKIVTFQTLLDDITTLAKLGDIKRNASNALINTTHQAQKNALKGNTVVEKIQLQTLLKLVIAEHPNLMTDTAFQILQADILYLEDH